jgi:hypothetical protein
MNKIIVTNAEKTIDLENGEYLHFWYANNAGNGDSNCTIVRSSVAERAPMSAKQSGIIRKTYTSSWRGNVNFSAKVQKELGL